FPWRNANVPDDLPGVGIVNADVPIVTIHGEAVAVRTERCPEPDAGLVQEPLLRMAKSFAVMPFPAPASRLAFVEQPFGQGNIIGLPFALGQGDAVLVALPLQLLCFLFGVLLGTERPLFVGFRLRTGILFRGGIGTGLLPLPEDAPQAQ